MILRRCRNPLLTAHRTPFNDAVIFQNLAFRDFLWALWISLWRIGAAVVQVTAPAGSCRGASSKA
jgi:hypothetical protein